MRLQGAMIQRLFRLLGIIRNDSIVFNLTDPTRVLVLSISLDRGDALVIRLKNLIVEEDTESFAFNYQTLNKFITGLRGTDLVQIRIEHRGVLVLDAPNGTRTIRLNAFPKELLQVEQLISRFEHPVEMVVDRLALETLLQNALEVDPTTFHLRTSVAVPNRLEVHTRKIDQSYLGHLTPLKTESTTDLDCLFTRAPFAAIRGLGVSSLRYRMSKEHLELFFEDEMFEVHYLDRTLIDD